MATRQELEQAMMAAHNAGDTVNAGRLAEILAQMPPEQPMGLGDALAGAGNVALNGLKATGHQLMGTAFGIGGALQGAAGALGVPGADPNMSYMGGKNLYDQGVKVGASVIPPIQMSPEGQRVAQAIGRMPITPATKSNNYQPMHVQDIGTMIQNVGQGIEDYAGPEARDLAGSAATLLTSEIPASRVTGTAAEAAVRTAARNGYTIPSVTSVGKGQFAGSVTDRAARSLAGASQVDSRVAVRNQMVTDRLAASAGKLDDVAAPGALQRATDAAEGAYTAIKGLKGPGGGSLHIPLQSQSFYNRVLSLAKTPGWDPAIQLPDAIDKLKLELLSVHPTVEGVVNRVRQLRNDAFTNGKGDAEAQMLGRAQREAADILDDELSGHLQHIASTTSNPNLKSLMTRIYGEYTDARKQLSVLHDIRDAMNSTTGSVDAAKIAQLANEGRKLAPDLQKIADAYNALGPTGMKSVEKAAPQAGSPFNLHETATAAAVGGGAGALAGGGTGSMWGATIGALAIPTSRYLAREYALRGPVIRGVQKVVGPATKASGAAAIGGNNLEEQQP